MIMAKKLLFIISGLLAAALLLWVYATRIEPRLLSVTYINIYSPFLGKQNAPLKIALFADIHIKSPADLDRLDKIVKKINAEKPDLVFFGGDLFDTYNIYPGSGRPADIERIIQALSKIDASLGKYCVAGNHDYGGGANAVYKNLLEAAGFTVLANEIAVLQQAGLTITGIDDLYWASGLEGAAAAAYALPGCFNIALCHEPDMADELLDCNIDLFLAAHTHGRQINIPLLDYKILPPFGQKYIRGIYMLDKERPMTIYVNRGLGTSQYEARLFSIPEITVLTINAR